MKPDCPTQAPKFTHRRFKAAVDLAGLSIEGVARKCKVSYRHLCYVLTNQRLPSAYLLQAIRTALGEPGWAFATGQTDTLRDEGVSHAA